MDEIGAKERLVFSSKMLPILLYFLLIHVRKSPNFDCSIHLISSEKNYVKRVGSSIPHKWLSRSRRDAMPMETYMNYESARRGN